MYLSQRPEQWEGHMHTPVFNSSVDNVPLRYSIGIDIAIPLEVFVLRQDWDGHTAHTGHKEKKVDSTTLKYSHII